MNEGGRRRSSWFAARAPWLATLISLAVLLGAGAPPVAAAAPNSLSLAATYDVDAKLSFANRTLDVSSAATVSNPTSHAVSRLSFNLLPARIGNLVLKGVTVDDKSADAKISDQTVIVTLPAPLEAGAAAVVTIDYRAKLRSTLGDKNFLFAKVSGIVTAYRWIPWLSRAVKFKRPNFGDPFVTGISSRVTVRLRTDKKAQVAATGTRKSVNGLTQTFVARDVRDFNFAASTKYKRRSVTWNGITITAYYIRLNPDRLLKSAKRALKAYSNKVGAYAYKRLAVAESSGGIGMESPGLVWIPEQTRSGNIPYLVAHEIAHEWFYAVVGNDRALEPFAAEGIAEFLARDLTSTWRKSKCAPKELDKTIYEYSRSCYYEIVYIQGARYLKAYRTRVGPDAFWAGVRDYYQTYSWQMPGTRVLLDTLDAAAIAAGKKPGSHTARFPRLYP